MVAFSFLDAKKERNKQPNITIKMISIKTLFPLSDISRLGYGVVLPLLALALLRFKMRRKEIDPKRIKFQRASHFRPEAVPKKIDTIVIGSGPGACTCANLLAQSGHRVLMLEQHTVTGGGTHSFQLKGCEWDTGLHYSSTGMSQKTARPGAIMDYMTKGKQQFKKFPEPCDEIFFPDHCSYPFLDGKKKTINALVDPADEELKRRVETYMDIYTDVHQGFVGLGLSRILPSWLHFLVRGRVNRYVNDTLCLFVYCKSLLLC